MSFIDILYIKSILIWNLLTGFFKIITYFNLQSDFTRITISTSAVSLELKL